MKKITDKNNSNEQISQLLETYVNSKNPTEKEKARTLIVIEMTPVVKRIARTIARRDYDPIEDLTQAGFIGLLKAIDTYSKKKNDNFRVYAGYYIIGEIRHYLRDKLKMIRVPRYIHELSIRIHSFTESLTKEEVEELTNEEVASALRVSTKVVNYAREADRRSSTISFDEYFSKNDEHLSFEEMFGDDYEERENTEDLKIIFDDIIDELSPENKVLIEMYYRQGMSKTEISDALVMNRATGYRKIKAAFDEMATLVAKKKVREDFTPNN